MDIGPGVVASIRLSNLNKSSKFHIIVLSLENRAYDQEHAFLHVKLNPTVVNRNEPRMFPKVPEGSKNDGDDEAATKTPDCPSRFP